MRKQKNIIRADEPKAPEIPPESEATVETIPDTVAINRCFRYHPEHGARIFEAGEPIPAGWEDSPAKFKE